MTHRWNYLVPLRIFRKTYISAKACKSVLLPDKYGTNPKFWTYFKRINL